MVQALVDQIPPSEAYPDDWVSPACSAARARVCGVDILNPVEGGTFVRFNMAQAVEGFGEIPMPSWAAETTLEALAYDAELGAWSQLAQLAIYAISAKLWARKAATL
jgi:hypothetical protein